MSTEQDGQRASTVSPERIGCALRPLIRAPQMGRIERIAYKLGRCSEGWESDACLLGNVTAEEIRDLCQWVIRHNSAHHNPAQAEKESGE